VNIAVIKAEQETRIGMSKWSMHSFPTLELVKSSMTLPSQCKISGTAGLKLECGSIKWAKN